MLNSASSKIPLKSDRGLFFKLRSTKTSKRICISLQQIRITKFDLKEGKSDTPTIWKRISRESIIPRPRHSNSLLRRITKESDSKERSDRKISKRKIRSILIHSLFPFALSTFFPSLNRERYSIYNSSQLHRPFSIGPVNIWRTVQYIEQKFFPFLTDEYKFLSRTIQLSLLQIVPISTISTERSFVLFTFYIFLTIDIVSLTFLPSSSFSRISKKSW